MKPRRILGPEFADYVKQVGLRGIFHSDELPDYGITENEVQEVRRELEIKDIDAFVLIAEKEDRIIKATEILIQRAKQTFEGVPEETRDANADGTSSYSRPLPGRARMYPETDVPPITVSKELLEGLKSNLPELPEEKLKRIALTYEINEEQAKQLIKKGNDGLFEELASVHKDKKMNNLISRTILNTIPELESEGVDVSLITKEMLQELFQAFHSGKLAKEGIPVILKNTAVQNISIQQAITESGFEMMDVESVERILEGIIKENTELINKKGLDAVGPLIGIAMKKLRGKADGKLINELLREKIQKKM
jgi:glutamyl-tRNA(Gln) amidotransferase subunit E